MNVFSALLGELKGVFGKGYVLAGLLPAAVVVLGWRWWTNPDGGLAEVFREIVPFFAAETGDAVAELAALAALTLLLGLIFFAARSALLDFVQRLPLPRPLGWLREAMLRRQVRKLEALSHEGELLAHDLTVLHWAVPDRTAPGRPEAFTQPVYLPPHRRLPVDPTKIGNISAQTRWLVTSALPPPGRPLTPPSRRLTEQIRAGLEQLYVFAKDHYESPACKREIALWEELLEDERCRRLLEILKAQRYRELVLPSDALEGYPPHEGLLPTRLGIRAAALDQYAARRFAGIPTSTLLSRLWGVLDDEREQLANNRLSIEVLLNLAASMLLLAGAVLARGLWEAWPWSLPGRGAGSATLGVWLREAVDPRSLGFVLLPVLFAVLLYRAAVFSYGALAEKVIRAVDLKRLDLIEKLGFPRPSYAGEELELWAELKDHFAYGKPVDPDRPLGGAGELGGGEGIADEDEGVEIEL